jgi:hypothetical protein
MKALQDKRYRRGEATVSAAMGAAAFLLEDSETPDAVRTNAAALAKASASLLGDLRRLQVEEYGDTFLSGFDRRIQNDITEFVEDLREAAKEAQEVSRRG